MTRSSFDLTHSVSLYKEKTPKSTDSNKSRFLIVFLIFLEVDFNGFFGHPSRFSLLFFRSVASALFKLLHHKIRLHKMYSLQSSPLYKNLYIERMNSTLPRPRNGASLRMLTKNI